MRVVASLTRIHLLFPNGRRYGFGTEDPIEIYAFSVLWQPYLVVPLDRADCSLDPVQGAQEFTKPAEENFYILTTLFPHTLFPISIVLVLEYTEKKEGTKSNKL